MEKSMQYSPRRTCKKSLWHSIQHKLLCHVICISLPVFAQHAPVLVLKNNAYDRSIKRLHNILKILNLIYSEIL